MLLKSGEIYEMAVKLFSRALRGYHCGLEMRLEIRVEV
jgi:hypothetical protein